MVVRLRAGSRMRNDGRSPSHLNVLGGRLGRQAGRQAGKRGLLPVQVCLWIYDLRFTMHLMAETLLLLLRLTVGSCFELIQMRCMNEDRFG